MTYPTLNVMQFNTICNKLTNRKCNNIVLEAPSFYGYRESLES